MMDYPNMLWLELFQQSAGRNVWIFCISAHLDSDSGDAASIAQLPQKKAFGRTGDLAEPFNNQQTWKISFLIDFSPFLTHF